jgi:hypothetical protein
MQIILNLLNNVFDANTQAKFVFFLFSFPLWFQSYTPDSIEKGQIAIFILLLYSTVLCNYYRLFWTTIHRSSSILAIMSFMDPALFLLFTLCRNEGIRVIWTHSSMLKQIAIGHHICLCLNH